MGLTNQALESLTAVISLKVRQNPSHASRFFELYAGDVNKRVNLKNDSNCSHQIRTILDNNSFGISVGTLTKAYIWRHASFFNHSCVPNVHRHFINDFIVMTCKRDVHAGEELCISYSAMGEEFASRSKKFKHYGFSCQCSLCAFEVNQPEIYKFQRSRLLQDYRDRLAPWFDRRAALSPSDRSLLLVHLQDLVHNLCDNYIASGRTQFWYDISEAGPALAVLQTELNMESQAIATWTLMVGKCNDGEEGAVGLSTALAALRYRTKKLGGCETDLSDVVRAWRVAGKDPTASGHWQEMHHMWIDCTNVEDSIRSTFAQLELEHSTQ